MKRPRPYPLEALKRMRARDKEACVTAVRPLLEEQDLAERIRAGAGAALERHTADASACRRGEEARLQEGSARALDLAALDRHEETNAARLAALRERARLADDGVTRAAAAVEQALAALSTAEGAEKAVQEHRAAFERGAVRAAELSAEEDAADAFRAATHAARGRSPG